MSAKEFIKYAIIIAIVMAVMAQINRPKVNVNVRTGHQMLELDGDEIPITTITEIPGDDFVLGDYVMEERFYFILVGPEDERYAVEVDKTTFNRADIEIGSQIIGDENQ